jgi:RecX family.
MQLQKVNTLIANGNSKIFIKNYLFRKEIDEKLSSDIFAELDEEDTNWEIKSARIFARKKNIKKDDNNNEKNLSKMARAGFSYEIVKKILEEN